MKDRPRINHIAFFGLGVILAFEDEFMLWSILAPLEEAAVAQGKVAVNGHHKVIDHLEGGIIKAIYVHDGSLVKKGQVLVSLNDINSRAELEIINTQLNNYLATKARLVAERDLVDKITWPHKFLSQQNNPEIKQLMLTQENIFVTNKKALDGQLKILHQRIQQFNKQIDSLNAQVEANDQQAKLIEEERIAVAILEQKKIVSRPRLLALMREKARLEGNKGENLGQIAKAQQQIGETEQQIITIKDTNLQKTLQQLDDTQTQIASLEEKRISAQDVFNRTKIFAPQDGIVNDLQIHTIGGVISPGEKLMDIVPDNDQLVIDAEINPLDIDIVRPGMQAKVKLTPYKQRNDPMFIGKVERISADTNVDDNSKKPYYSVRVLIDKSQLAKNPEIILYPGMPANVLIITGKRSAFRYFLQPFIDSFDRAFKEE